MYKGKARHDDYGMENIAYQGIYQLFVNDDMMTESRLARMVYKNNCGANRNRISRLVKGENVKMTIQEIKKLIEITGKSFEELFELREKEVE
jgi:hypothetical protein